MFDDLLELIFGTDIGESGDGGLYDFIQSLFGFGGDGSFDAESISPLLSLLGSYGLNRSGVLDPKIPQVGYQGGIPDYTGVRQRAPLATGIEYTDETGRPYVAPTGSGLGALAGEVMPQGGGPANPYTPTGRVVPLGYDPNRRPGSGGRRYFTDMQYVPTGGDMGEDVAPDQAALAQARAQADQQGLALLLGNLSNLARERRSGDPTNIMPTQAGPMPTDNYVPPQPEPEPEPEPAPAPEPEPPDGGGDGDGDGDGPGTDPGFFPPPGGGDPVKDPVFPHGGDDPSLADDDGYTGPEPEPAPAPEPEPESEPEIADRDGYTDPGGNGIVDAAPNYFMVDGQRFENRDAAIALARALGDPGGIEYFSADGTLISGRPQYTAEELEEQRRLAAERQAEFEAQLERNRQRDAYWSGLIDEYGTDEYQQTVNQDDYYTIDSPRLGQLKFASFQDAKGFLERFNTGGEESITDVYDKSQRELLPTSFRKIQSSVGDKMYQSAGTPERQGEVFATRDEAIQNMLNQGISRDRAENLVREFAEGGIANLAKGRYLNGSTDGMADQIPASIDGKQPAALSDGEFVIPADVVSHLGNGNSDAGAKVLEEMMARTRKERTGNSKQGKQINPRNVLPS